MEMDTDGELVKQVRKHRSWSQEELAERAGLSLRTVQRVESDGVASLKTRKKIAQVLEIEVTRLALDEPGSAHKDGSEDGESKTKKIFPEKMSSFRTWATLKLLATFTLQLTLILLCLAGFLIVFNGIFDWESTPYSIWQSAGRSIMATVVFIGPLIYLTRWAYKYVKSIELVRPND